MYIYIYSELFLLQLDRKVKQTIKNDWIQVVISTFVIAPVTRVSM